MGHICPSFPHILLKGKPNQVQDIDLSYMEKSHHEEERSLISAPSGHREHTCCGQQPGFLQPQAVPSSSASFLIKPLLGSSHCSLRFYFWDLWDKFSGIPHHLVALVGVGGDARAGATHWTWGLGHHLLQQLGNLPDLPFPGVGLSCPLQERRH